MAAKARAALSALAAELDAATSKDALLRQLKVRVRRARSGAARSAALRRCCATACLRSSRSPWPSPPPRWARRWARSGCCATGTQCVRRELRLYWLTAPPTQEVRLLVACALGELLRICAPDMPFEDEAVQKVRGGGDASDSWATAHAMPPPGRLSPPHRRPAPPGRAGQRGELQSRRCAAGDAGQGALALQPAQTRTLQNLSCRPLPPRRSRSSCP